MKTAFSKNAVFIWMLLALLPAKLFAFALLGPVQPWMQPTNGVIEPGDIGGPMNLGSGYRWNVPVLTYGFDQSFLDYFGTNGVVAVEGAIQILNELPPASNLGITNYLLETQQFNYAVQSQNLLDLKSQTLVLLLEHMGLAPPTRNTFVLKNWTTQFAQVAANFGISSNASLNTDVVADWAIPDYIDELNFDPDSKTATSYVNGNQYFAIFNWQDEPQHLFQILSVDPYLDTYNAVADFNLYLGGYYSGLTYDDAGGLAYLLSTNNINYETLLPDVTGADTNANSFVNGAWRPGVDKISFLPQPADCMGNFLPLTNNYPDSYFTNGILQHQQLTRIVTQPDFLFSAGDVKTSMPYLLYYSRTGTTNWLNNSAVNENTNTDGPGVIQPPVKIIFNKLGRTLLTFGDEEIYDASGNLASFDGSTNPPIVYPISKAGTNSMTVRLLLSANLGQAYSSFEWNPASVSGTIFTLQTSTNLICWKDLFSVTNNRTISTLFTAPTSGQRYYRLIPQ